jgi:YD repeat-containing protein
MRGWWLALALWLVVAAGLAVPMAAHAQTYTSNYIWDANRRLVMVIAPDTGTGVLLATQYTYDSDGQLTQVQHGTTTSTTGSPFTAVETTTYTYDAGGRKTETTVLNGTYTNSTAHPALSLTQVDYDADDRPTCTATRLAPAGTLPTSACTQSSGGQDPISQTVYDADGRVQQVNEGVGTSIAITYAAYGYDANSFKTSITDARTNATTLNPDGFNRLASTAYPDATTEVNTYDAKGQVIAWTNRGGFTVNRTYDAMGNLDTEAGASGNLTARSWDLRKRCSYPT